MTSCLSDIIVDSRQPASLARWWAEALGYTVLREAKEGWVAIGPWASESDRPDEAAYRSGPQPPAMVFVPVANERVVKNRLHLDIWPVDRTRDEEVESLLTRGATLVDVGQQDVTWKVLADPEGNIFCVLDT